MIHLTRLDLAGYRSIRQLDDFRPQHLNVFIGANGAGKSNLISFFRLLGWMMAGELQFHVARAGGASALLHDGPAVTPQISAALQFQGAKGLNDYTLRLFHAAEDRLIFAEERYGFQRSDAPGAGRPRSLGSGHKESALLDPRALESKTARVLHMLLKRCVVHQFHNTTASARLKQRWPVDDGLYLKEDAGNLAPFLLRLRESQPLYYQRILRTCQSIAPFLADFVLEPRDGTLLLQWREHGSDLVFGPHQMSDGTLRAIALTALLLQPEGDLPGLILIDEPELGLHPFAIEVLGGLLRAASEHAQIFVATQSAALLSQVEPEEVVVVERHGRESVFTRLETARLAAWLESYALPEIWEKGIIGGRPGR